MKNYIWYDIIRCGKTPYYGIRGRQLTREGREEEHTVMYIHIDYNRIVHIIDVLQQYQVPLIHMEDIITDLVNA